MADKKTRESELTPHEAVTLFERGVRDNPKDAQARLNLGSGYYAAGNWDAALKEFQEAAALAPSLDHAHYYLGVLYAKRGDKDTARQELEKVLNGNGHYLLKNQAKIQIELLGK
ncbi:MAG: tetratricopeptide repeat protein [Chloroflexota bacterium]|nr:tetratricopeptide repeat protein [Chloroflexota bacterium]